MRRRVVKWILFGVVLPLAIVAGFFVGDVCRLSRAFDARVARYRAAGLVVEWSEVSDPGVPDAENMAGPLHLAHEFLEAQDEETRHFPWGHSEGWPATETERADLRKYLVKVQPAVAHVEEALSRPVLRMSLKPFQSAVVWLAPIQDAQYAVYLTEWRVHAGDLSVAQGIRSVLTLADGWRPRTSVESLVRKGLRTVGLGWLRDEIRRGGALAPDDAREWSELLRRAEGEEWDALRHTVDEARLTLLAVVEAYRRGADPVGELIGDTHMLDRLIRRFLFSAPSSPSEYAGWLARPRLYLEIGDALDALDSRGLVPMNEPELRASLRSRWSTGMTQFVSDEFARFKSLAHLSIVRLARIAIRLRLLAQTGETLPTRLEDLGSQGDHDLEDSLTGEPFLWERAGAGVFVASRITDPDWPSGRSPGREIPGPQLRTELLDRLLGWEIR